MGTLEMLKEAYPELIGFEEDLGMVQAAVVSSGDWLKLFGALKTRGFDLLIELGAADYKTYPLEKPGRFAVCAHLMRTSDWKRACLKTYLPEQGPQLPSLTGIYEAADWYEREAWDMFGIFFDGHKNLKRILMYPEFEGHALRKDYPLNKQQPLMPLRESVDYEQVRATQRKAALLNPEA
jgi:NADH-quinone oxidoreductase subunit C